MLTETLSTELGRLLDTAVSEHEGVVIGTRRVLTTHTGSLDRFATALTGVQVLVVYTMSVGVFAVSVYLLHGM